MNGGVRQDETLAGVANTWTECEGKPSLTGMGQANPAFISGRDEGPRERDGSLEEEIEKLSFFRL